jgi:hypothetical protein
MGVYTLISASYKRDFNKGVLLVAYIRTHIKEGNEVKHQDLEVISRLLVRERSLEQLQIQALNSMWAVAQALATYYTLQTYCSEIRCVCCAHTGVGHWSSYRL